MNSCSYYNLKIEKKIQSFLVVFLTVFATTPQHQLLEPLLRPCLQICFEIFSRFLVHEGKTFKCFAKRCTACFVESEELEEHDLTVHDGKMMVKYIKLKEKQSKERVPPSQKRVICTVCGKSYTTKNVLKLHVNQVHLKQRKYCDQCPMSFSTATSIRWVMEFLNLEYKIS